MTCNSTFEAIATVYFFIVTFTFISVTEMPVHDNDSLPMKNLKSILQQNFEEEIRIKNTEWRHLTDAGENFGSLILAIDVTLICNLKTELLHSVAKLPPPSSYLLELFNSPFTFRKELAFYKDLTPEFLQLQRENGIVDPELSWLGPKYIGGRMDLNDTGEFDNNQASIVLENLNYSGYKMVDRLIGLNRQQTEFAVKQLAKLHAMGIAMRQNKPRLFTKMVLPVLASFENETTKRCVMDWIEKSLEDLSKIQEAKPYMNIVKKTIETAAKIGVNKKDDEKWRTLVHNDFWVNNMMFKFNQTNDVVDMKIVDFQLCGYDYGIKDLLFFLMSSPMNDIIDDIFDDMVNVYYNSFIAALRVFKINIAEYTKKKLIDLLEYCAPSKLTQCLMTVQIIKSQPGSAPNIEATNKENFLQIGDGKAYYDKLLLIMNIFKKRGWLINNTI